MATFDNELTLIGHETSTDEYGDTVRVETRTTVLCDLESVTRAEHYAAAQNDMRPESVFILNKHEYQGQREVEFEDKRYSVTRTYAPKKQDNIALFETIELICQGVDQ